MDNNTAITLFHDYIRSADQKDIDLYDLVCELEDEETALFNDMRLIPGSCVDPFICYDEEDEDGNTIQLYDTNNLFLSIENNYWRFFVKDLQSEETGILGRTYPDKRIVEMDQTVSNDKSTILHEMIHVYEAILKESVDQHYHDIITIALYNDLSKKIPDLIDRIIEHSHTISNNQVAHIGGRHGILFYLKSLDLDLRLNLKLGSVMGYGRDKT